jgi:pSer/pThr/pTyr-binding forkhead associated (FHA) protein
MKLLFPNDEHGPVTLDDGTALVGSASDCDVRLTMAGIAERHCELITEHGQTRARPLTDKAATVLNGKQIVGEAPLRPGDLLLFAKVGCRIVASAAARPTPPPPSAADADDDMGHTRVRMALPKYVLRGVSGPTFGKVYAMVGTLNVGRSADADICIPIEEISRQHARLQSAAAGLVVEDLGSANGTWVNDERVHTPTLLKPGDEVRFDTVRFLLVSPAQEAAAATARAAAEAEAPAAGGGSGLWIVAGIVTAIALVLALLRYLGKI